MTFARDIHPEFKSFSRYTVFGLSALGLSTGVAVGLAAGRDQAAPAYLATVAASAMLGVLTGLMVAGFALPLVFAVAWRKSADGEGWLPQARAETVTVAVTAAGVNVTV